MTGSTILTYIKILTGDTILTGHTILKYNMILTKKKRKNFMSMKNPMTPPGIEPATFRFVAQHLNYCATAVPKVH
jgi:hypothetical protein